MPLDAIPIVVINAAAKQSGDEAGLSGNAPVLLREIAELARRLLASGESSAIDLRALPLTPADLDWLRETLGQGQVAATLEAEGESTLSETVCPGVWWVTHRNETGAVVSEFIEVTYFPELLKAHPDDVQTGLEHLDLLISDLS
ncbi:MAG: hydrogenase expression/formation protein [Hydrogenophilales bacterium 28-61-23]|nr:MAG: hydrogenase expression/formation protein [Hydrogenophilales bacterium 28-61-23]